MGYSGKGKRTGGSLLDDGALVGTTATLLTSRGRSSSNRSGSRGGHFLLVLTHYF